MSAQVPKLLRRSLSRWVGVGLIALPFLLGIAMPQERDRESEQVKRSVAAGHETRDLPVRGILVFGIVFVIAIALVIALVTALNVVFVGRLSSSPFPPTDLANAPIPPLPPAPRLEQVPGAALQESRARDEAILKSYGWVDRNAGIVHIPIDRAMDILLQRGLPVRPEAGDKFKDDGRQSPSSSSSGRVMEPYP